MQMTRRSDEVKRARRTEETGKEENSERWRCVSEQSPRIPEIRFKQESQAQSEIPARSKVHNTKKEKLRHTVSSARSRTKRFRTSALHVCLHHCKERQSKRTGRRAAAQSRETLKAQSSRTQSGTKSPKRDVDIRYLSSANFWSTHHTASPPPNRSILHLHSLSPCQASTCLPHPHHHLLQHPPRLLQTENSQRLVVLQLMRACRVWPCVGGCL